MAAERMKKFQSLEIAKGLFSNRWNFLLLLGLLLHGNGCASLGPREDVAPVPMGPLEAAPRPPARAPASEVYPERSPGWDAPEPAPVPGRPVVVPAIPVRMSEDYLRLQIMLDRQNFSPGCLDGRTGTQSRLALRAWQKSRGLAATGEPDAAVWALTPADADAFVTHVVGAADFEGLAPVPKTWRAKAQVATLSHATVQERLAEQYHVSQRALKELNPAAAWPDPAPGTVLRVPRVRPYPKVLAARIEIHLGGKYVQVLGYDGKLEAHFPCSIARDKAKRPVGELHVANAAENPNYTFKPELFAEDGEASSIRGNLLIPPGPNNPVGVAWLSLDRPGYGIHGTPHPEDIGRTESHGCFRLANWNARKLLAMVTIGLPVTVYDQ
jgi:lipoprotein-anchoring transpeptidase ErfK/SrfK